MGGIILGGVGVAVGFGGWSFFVVLVFVCLCVCWWFVCVGSLVCGFWLVIYFSFHLNSGDLVSEY